MLSARGDRGAIRVGYQQAATFRDWHLTQNRDTLGARNSEVAVVVSWMDSYWVTKKVSALGLWMGQCWWVWSEVTIPDSQYIVPGVRIQLKVMGDPEISNSF